MTQATADRVVVDAEALGAVVTRLFTDAGVPERDAEVSARVLVRTDMRGVHTHGLNLVAPYLDNLHRGGIVADGRARVVRDGRSTAVLDGCAGLGEAVAHEATQLAIAKARQHGVGMVAVRGGSHFGAAGIYALDCAEAGLIGIVMSSGVPVMRAAGAAGRLLSNAPIAYGVPADPFPLVLDVAMSVVAGQKVLMAGKRGESVPEGWIVDAEGRPSTDPADYFANGAGGALVPIGDHKGSGIAVLVEVLATALSGAARLNPTNFIEHPDRPSDTGHAFLAVDVEEFAPADEFRARVGELTDAIHAATPAAGVDRVYVPGELEFERETAARRDGLPLPPAVWESLAQAAVAGGLGPEIEATRRGRP